MPIAAIMEFKGGTLEQYDEVIKRMGFEPGAAGAAGGLFHWAAATEDGIRITDVWETPEQFQGFAEGQIGPITQEVGFEGEPDVTIIPVHSYLTAGP